MQISVISVGRTPHVRGVLDLGVMVHHVLLEGKNTSNNVLNTCFDVCNNTLLTFGADTNDL